MQYRATYNINYPYPTSVSMHDLFSYPYDMQHAVTADSGLEALEFWSLSCEIECRKAPAHSQSPKTRLPLIRKFAFRKLEVSI